MGEEEREAGYYIRDHSIITFRGKFEREGYITLTVFKINAMAASLNDDDFEFIA